MKKAICPTGIYRKGEFAHEAEKHIVILGTSDMHANIWGYSYEDNEETGNNSMARLYTYIQQVREEYPDTFLVDAGDVIQGTILSDDLCSYGIICGV